MSEAVDITLDERLRHIADERDRLDREQESLRGDAEEELRKIQQMVEEIRKSINESERQIEALQKRQENIEDFLQKLNTRSHPLRRAAVA